MKQIYCIAYTSASLILQWVSILCCSLHFFVTYMKLPEKNYALQCFHYYAVYDSLYKTGSTVGNETELKWIAVKRLLFIQLYKRAFPSSATYFHLFSFKDCSNAKATFLWPFMLNHECTNRGFSVL